VLPENKRERCGVKALSGLLVRDKSSTLQSVIQLHLHKLPAGAINKKANQKSIKGHSEKRGKITK